MLGVEKIQAWTHFLYITIQHLHVWEIERRSELLEKLVADAASPYGTQRGVGRKWNLRQPFHGLLDPRSEVCREFLEHDAFHDQVHCPLVDKVVYDPGNTWRFWGIRLLYMREDKFLGCPLRLEIPPRAILHEVFHPDVYIGSVVNILRILFLMPCARGYDGGLQLFLAHCEVPGLIREG